MTTGKSPLLKEPKPHFRVPLESLFYIVIINMIHMVILLDIEESIINIQIHTLLLINMMNTTTGLRLQYLKEMA